MRRRSRRGGRGAFGGDDLDSDVPEPLATVGQLSSPHFASFFFFLRAIVSHTTRGGSSVVVRPTTPFVSILPFRPQVSLGSPFAPSLSVCFRFNLSSYTVGCKYQDAYMLRLFQHIHRFYSDGILRYKACRIRINFRIYDKIIKKIQRVESIQFILTPRNV